MDFFFQAEDGIRDYDVTGVQTCALPISDISIHDAAEKGNIEAVKQHLADGAGCVDLRGLLLCPQPT